MEPPDGTNFYSHLSAGTTAAETARRFGAAGWRLRQCGFTEFEARWNECELVIENNSRGEVLVHGIVWPLPAGPEAVLALLEGSGFPHTAELYGPEGGMIAEWRGGGGAG